MTQIFMNLTPQNYLKAIELILYFKQELSDPAGSKVSNLPLDANRTFILFCLTNVNRALLQSDMDSMLQYANVAAVDGALLIESNDIHLK